MTEIKEFFIRIRFPRPLPDGREGAAAIVGAPNARRAKEIAMLPANGYPPGSKIIDVWSRVE